MDQKFDLNADEKILTQKQCNNNNNNNDRCGFCNCFHLKVFLNKILVCFKIYTIKLYV